MYGKEGVMDKVKQALRDVQHFGEEGGVVPVIDVAATSTFLDPADMEAAFHGGCRADTCTAATRTPP